MRRKVFPVIFSVLGLALFAVAVEQYYRMFVSNITAKDNEQHLLYIFPDSSIDSVFFAIRETHNVASRWNLNLHARLLRFSHPRPGCYTLYPKEGDFALIRRLRAGEQTPVEVTFNNIRTRAQLARRLSDQLLLDSAQVATRLESNEYMAKFGLNRETAVCLFLPNTYQLYWTISADALFERMQKEYNHFWTPERDERAKQIGLSRVQVATLASIIEEETNKEFEYPIIAGLYINRLRKGMPLQACPTIKFAWQDFSIRRILNKHLLIDSPYNTYINIGLPPGPIRIARTYTINQVLFYSPNKFLFMCASAEFNGTHHFSYTYSQHHNYAREYQAPNKRTKLLLLHEMHKREMEERRWGAWRTGEVGSGRTGEVGSGRTGEVGSGRTGEVGGWSKVVGGWSKVGVREKRQIVKFRESIEYA